MSLGHITNRGNNRAPIFFDDSDYIEFLRILATVSLECGWIKHAHCLMPNHNHLLLEYPETGPGRGMHLLNGRYARYVNTRYARSGHVFGSRYRIEPVTRDAHLLEASRYIVLNPVRAGICSLPSDWPW